MENKGFLEFTENRKFKLLLLLILLIAALLYVYFYLTDIENVPDSIRYSGYTKSTSFEILLSLPFFLSGLLMFIPLFQNSPNNDYASAAALILGPLLWVIYFIVGKKYLSSERTESYKFLGWFVLILVLNISGCTSNTF